MKWSMLLLEKEIVLEVVQMGRDLESIFRELTIVKTKELEDCNKELTNTDYNSVVRKALLVYKHGLLESLEMYDLYLEKRGTLLI
jgi:hypothetical protein